MAQNPCLLNFIRSGKRTRAIKKRSRKCVRSRIDHIYRKMTRINFRDFPGNSVLDVQLPVGNGLSAGQLSGAIKGFAQMGGATLQPVCVSTDEMRDAQTHPERHGGLVVRVCGLSARFVCLERRVQDEIIGRATLAV